MLRYFKKITSLVMAATLVFASIALITPTVLADPAYSVITVTDGGDRFYADTGSTYISTETNVFVEAEQDVEYYVLSAGYVDVFYNSAVDTPLGSYFKPPFADGAWVTTIGGDIANAPKTLLTNDMKVTIPAPAAGNTFELRVAAVKSGADTVVYGHNFIGEYCVLESALENDKIVSSLTVYSENTVKCMFIIGIFKDGRLAYVANSGEFSVDGNNTASTDFNVDINQYPPSEYEYKVFCWNPNFVPLAPEVVVN